MDSEPFNSASTSWMQLAQKTPLISTSHSASLHQWTFAFAFAAFSYCFLFMFAMHSFILQCRKNKNPAGLKPGGSSWQQAFYALLAFGSVVRIFHNGYGALLVWRDILIPFQLIYLMNTLPSFVFVSTYMILLFFWAEIYHAGRSECLNTSIHRFRPLFIAINVFLYSIMFLIYFFDISATPLKYSTPMSDHFLRYEICGIYFGGLVYFCLALSYLIYGGLIYQRLDKIKCHSVFRAKLLHKVKFITLLLSFCFLSRSLVVFFSSQIRFAFVESWWFYIIYWISTEVFCLSLMFHILAQEIPTQYSPFAYQQYGSITASPVLSGRVLRGCNHSQPSSSTTTHSVWSHSMRSPSNEGGFVKGDEAVFIISTLEEDHKVIHQQR